MHRHLYCRHHCRRHGDAPLHTRRATAPPPPPRRSGPEDFARMQRRQFDKLGLTPEQDAKIKPIVEAGTEELRRLRRESFERARAVIEQMEAQVAKELTPAQRQQLAELQKAQRERMQKWNTERAAERQKRNERAGRDDRPPAPGPDESPDNLRPPPPPEK
ncbi:hypothetical protein Ga0100231_012600 [Opitutaceae bacterium TAV4]|nr:hypothetical protein Ga0100231_012600 [Opitutaceae bacterium TAV4]